MFTGIKQHVSLKARGIQILNVVALGMSVIATQYEREELKRHSQKTSIRYKIITLDEVIKIDIHHWKTMHTHKINNN